MAWSLDNAVEHNRLALVAVVAELCHYAGFGGSDAATLPRLVRNAVLRLLRPAEAAARRLIVAMAAAIKVPGVTIWAARPFSPPAGRRWPSEATSDEGTSAIHDAAPIPLTNRGQRLGAASPGLAILSPQAGRGGATFPLFDPLRRFDPRVRHQSAGLPRISLPGVIDRLALPAKPSASDPVDTTRLQLRLVALKRALDDLPGQAGRFVRLRARAEARRRFEAAWGQRKQSRPFRLTGLRPGKPPGYRARNCHAVDGILAECHALARSTLNRPDTS